MINLISAWNKFLLLAIACLSSSLSNAAYQLSSTYDATNFFDNFNFDTIPDPTHGVVEYIDRSSATSLGLIKYDASNKVYIGVDYTSVLYWAGRKSIRLSSKRTLNGNNLIIIDLDHMPSTAGKVLPQGCSVWPAFWTFGPNWPNSGEIDIIEYVNTDSAVATTLHSNAGCDQTNISPNVFTGIWGKSNYVSNTNCDVNAAGQFSNTGCGIVGASNSVGAAFNSQTNNGNGKGGVFALEWDTTGNKIQSFYFPRGSVPQDILNKKPAPSTWGTPYARFVVGPANCPSSKFANHNIIFDTTFCGDWAGNSYVFGAACSTTISCVDFVQSNPAEFSEAYWLINYLDIYDISTTIAAAPLPVAATPVSLLTTAPAAKPTVAPSSLPTKTPVNAPTVTPTSSPTLLPMIYTGAPSKQPTVAPSNRPTVVPSNAPVAAIAAASSSYTSIGCFADNYFYRAMTKVYAGNTYTIGLCAETAAKDSYKYFALQYAGECWASNSLVETQQYGQSTQCIMACKSDNTVTCGGSLANYVYSLTPTTATTGTVATSSGFSSVGCYADNLFLRAMTYQYGGGNSYTIESCATAATKDGYLYFALQYGGECWASNNLIDSEKYGISSSCTMICRATPSGTATCGGPLANAIYATATQPPPPAATTITTSTYASLGCYIDGSPRAMSKQYSGNTYTIDTCFAVAKADAYQYFALQYGGECWASKSLTDSQRYGISTQCNMICRVASTGTAICGGPNANAMYSVIIAIQSMDSITASSGQTSATESKDTHSSSAVNAMFGIIIAIVSTVILGTLVAILFLFKTRILRAFKSSSYATNDAYDSSSAAAAVPMSHSEESGRGTWIGNSFKELTATIINNRSYKNRGNSNNNVVPKVVTTTTTGTLLTTAAASNNPDNISNDPQRHHSDPTMYDDGGYDTDTDSPQRGDTHMFLTGDAYNDSSATTSVSVAGTRLGLSSRSSKFGQMTSQFNADVNNDSNVSTTGELTVDSGGEMSVTEAINKKLKVVTKKDK